MSNTVTPETRLVGLLLTVGSLLLIAGFVTGPDIAGEGEEAMASMLANESAWTLSNWLVAIAMACFGVAGLAALAGTARTGWGRIGAAALGIGAGAVMVLTLLQATVAPALAQAGETEIFSAFTAFGDGMVVVGATTFWFGILAIALGEAGDPSRVTPSWAAWTAVALGVVVVLAHPIVVGMELTELEPIFLAMLPLVLYVVWLGVATAMRGMRTHAGPSVEGAQEGQ